MAVKQAVAPADSSGDMAFCDAVIRSQTAASIAYSPNSSAAAILFDDLTANAQGRGAVAAITATVSVRLDGRTAGRVKIDIRGGHGLEAGLKGELITLDGSKRHRKRFTRSSGDIVLSWTRRAKPGETIQLCIVAICRVVDVGENSGGLLQIDSVDMVTLPSKK